MELISLIVCHSPILTHLNGHGVSTFLETICTTWIAHIDWRVSAAFRWSHIKHLVYLTNDLVWGRRSCWVTEEYVGSQCTACSHRSHVSKCLSTEVFHLEDNVIVVSIERTTQVLADKQPCTTRSWIFIDNGRFTSVKGKHHVVQVKVTLVSTVWPVLKAKEHLLAHMEGRCIARMHIWHICHSASAIISHAITYNTRFIQFTLRIESVASTAIRLL